MLLKAIRREVEAFELACIQLDMLAVVGLDIDILAIKICRFFSWKMRGGMRLSIVVKHGGEIIQGSRVLVNGGGDLGTRGVI